MADLRMFFIEENDALDLNKHKRDTDTDMRPNEKPSEWMKRLKEMNHD